jgi:hypothetical protein
MQQKRMTWYTTYGPYQTRSSAAMREPLLWTRGRMRPLTHYPERFADIRATYAPQLAALSHCLP